MGFRLLYVIAIVAILLLVLMLAVVAMLCRKKRGTSGAGSAADSTQQEPFNTMAAVLNPMYETNRSEQDSKAATYSDIVVNPDLRNHDYDTISNPAYAELSGQPGRSDSTLTNQNYDTNRMGLANPTHSDRTSLTHSNVANSADAIEI